MVNVERLRTELEFITRNKKHHNQGLWFTEPKDKDNACGTTGCLAGWTAIHHAKDELQSYNVQRYMDGKYIAFIEYEPINCSWTSLGADLLGLNANIADELFHENNTLWDLWHIANVVTHGEIEIPEQVESDKDKYNRTEDKDSYIFELLEDF